MLVRKWTYPKELFKTDIEMVQLISKFKKLNDIHKKQNDCCICVYDGKKNRIVWYVKLMYYFVNAMNVKVTTSQKNFILNFNFFLLKESRANLKSIMMKKPRYSTLKSQVNNTTWVNLWHKYSTFQHFMKQANIWLFITAFNNKPNTLQKQISLSRHFSNKQIFDCS